MAEAVVSVRKGSARKAETFRSPRSHPPEPRRPDEASGGTRSGQPGYFANDDRYTIQAATRATSASDSEET